MADETSNGTAQRVQLSVNRRTGTAPAGMFFSAVALGFDVEDPYFDLRYKWSFGDAGFYTRHDTTDLPWGKYYRVDGALVLVEDGTVPKGQTVEFLGNDKNVAYGPHVCHVFERPGDYTVSCEVQQRGRAPVTATLQVFIDNPALQFAGRATICVAPSGNFDGAPAGALGVRSFAEAVQQARRSKSENLRILLRRGEWHQTPSSRKDREIGKKNLRRLHWGAFGAGPPPAYGPHNIFLRGKSTEEYCVWGLNYEGPYRADEPWTTSPVNADAIFVQGKGFTTIWDCSLRGGGTLITVGRNGTDTIVGNCLGTDWHNYGMFGNRGIARVGLCGVWLKQNPKAVIGNDQKKGEKQPPFYQDHAPFRCSSLGGPVAFNLCDLRSVGSWTGYYQPCLRIGRSPNGSAAVIEEAVMERIRGENGRMLGTGNSGQIAYPRRYLWDKIYLVLLPQGGSVFSPRVSGLQYRNVIVVIPDVPRAGKGHLTRWITRAQPAKGAVDQPQMRAFGVTLMNSTLIDHRSSHLMSFETDQMQADYAFVRIENNIVYTPNKNDPTATGDAPLDLSVMWRVTNTGMRYRNDPFAPIFATPPETAADYRPLPLSPAFSSATGEAIAVDDFFGRVRGPETSRGAIDALL